MDFQKHFVNLPRNTVIIIPLENKKQRIRTKIRDKLSIINCQLDKEQKYTIPDFDEYIRQGEPGKKELKLGAWLLACRLWMG